MTAPTSLIINSAFIEPQQHWAENTDRTLRQEPTRRPAGYEIIDTRENTRRQVSIPLVDDIRQRVGQWREAGWPGVTAVTLELLTHWWDKDCVSRRQYPFYFCQLEAIETLMWMLEAQSEYRQGINVQGDGGAFERLCNKMATGSGKTTVMAMIITWQVLNALTYPKSPRKYSSAILLVAPGLTVKSRLQVLMPGHTDNYYDSFELCPSEAMRQKLNRAEVLIENWHTLMPLKQQERSVVKKGKESDEAFTKRVLGKLAAYKDLVVINDEAHHAYRTPADVKISKAEAEALGIDLDEATRWVEGLDRLPSLFHQDPLRKRILYSLHIDLITQHLMKYVIEQNTLKLEPVFDGERPIGSTRDMRTWYTTRIAEPTQRCQVSHIVVDSGWEKYAANVVEAHPKVAAWVKNDHLGFHILYLWNGSKRKYIPDFLVRYTSGKTLVLEIKGEDTPQDQAKRAALAQWVDAVNAHGGFGIWAWDVVVGDAAGLQDMVEKHKH
ncbi:MAG: DEAD/DEAH box helicase family protein [Rhodoferax sp.]|nr:DEAD/DEAH box helicase family protein [Rhodoferax sp.]